jgi:anti-sigma factor RsiW
MPMSEKNKPMEPEDGNSTLFADDERLAARLSAYLDGELAGASLIEFEALLESDPKLARAVRDMRQIEHQLGLLGTDILSEEIPDTLLSTLSQKA